MRIQCNDLTHMISDGHKITLEFASEDLRREFAETLKSVYYAGPNFPNDTIEIRYLPNKEH